MKVQYKCLICGERYVSHIAAIHKLIGFYKNVTDKEKYNYGYIDERPILFENN